MGKSMLDDAKRGQLESMVKERKTKQEIEKFFLDNYRIALPKHIIYCAVHKLNKATGNASRKKRTYKKNRHLGGGDGAGFG